MQTETTDWEFVIKIPRVRCLSLSVDGCIFLINLVINMGFDIKSCSSLIRSDQSIHFLFVHNCHISQ